MGGLSILLRLYCDPHLSNRFYQRRIRLVNIADRAQVIAQISTKAFANRLAKMHTHLHTTTGVITAAHLTLPCKPLPPLQPHSIEPRLIRTTCIAHAQQPPQGSSNGSTPQQQQQQDDPVAAMMWAAQQDGYKIVFEDDDDHNELDDVMDDLEDPWMRNPSREQPHLHKAAAGPVFLTVQKLRLPLPVNTLCIYSNLLQTHARNTLHAYACLCDF